MEQKTKIVVALAIMFLYLASLISFASAIIVDIDYITIYPGEQGNVRIDVDNNENFDMEDVSIAIVLSAVSPTGEFISLPFTIIGNSEKDLDDLDEDDDDSASFTIKASTSIVPGDYNIPYLISYTNLDNDEKEQKQGTFGIRVSAKTDLDFGVETKGTQIDAPIVGEKGRITLEIINRGLGDIKSVSITANPEGYDLISKEKVFIGTVNAEDSDTASWEVLFTKKNPTLDVILKYNDFDNKEQIETIILPLQVYTTEEALNLGLISKSKTGIYIGVALFIIVVWVIYRTFKKRRKKKDKERR